jgi:hypothetical protein
MFENNTDGGAIKGLNNMSITHVYSVIIGITGETAAIVSTQLVIHSGSDAEIMTTIVGIWYSKGTTSWGRKWWMWLLLCWVVLVGTNMCREEKNWDGVDGCVGTMRLGEVVGEFRMNRVLGNVILGAMRRAWW